MITISSKIERKIRIDGEYFFYFSGTAYLGMGSLPEFEERIHSGIRQYGPNFGASRFGNLQLKVYEEMEAFFATQAEAEKAVLMSSGFMAGYLTAALLKNLSDRIWIAPDTHPAILPEGILRGEIQPLDQFKEKCVDMSWKTKGETIAILANAVDPLKAVIANFDWIRELLDQNTYYLLIDDSHAFGLIGKGIFGTYPSWKTLPVHLIISGSLGKALGIPAGIILGPSHFVDKIITDPKFIGASPPSPGFCKAFLTSQNLYSRQQEKLQVNNSYFYSLVKDMEEMFFQEKFPVAIFHSSGWAAPLKERNVLISSFPYPTPKDVPVDRIIISACHVKEDLEELVKHIQGVKSFNLQHNMD